MHKSIKDIDFKTVDMYDIIHMDKEFFEGMSNEQAADILEKQLERYNKGGLYSQATFRESARIGSKVT